ncbi:MAG: hypothetical protein IKQ27_12965 [Lachnospiraceae bacterium]|jgi:hypothetical protein|nr:hypothetical protein [Lachnospiraceae bacterium]MBR3736969.1 hypothetical protein [Lachnospiraceae bacterium]MBR6157865.1 hypothetical protein [Lachnospiraceae bacterium]
MEELLYRLNRVEDSYYDFVSAMARYAEKKPERLNKLLMFIKDNPTAKSSDIIEFVSDQADFFEDAAYMSAV